MTPALQSLLGLAVFTALAWLLSERRTMPPWRLIIVAIGLQIVIALIVLRVEVIADGLRALNVVVEAIEQAAGNGAAYVFGFLATSDPAGLPFEVTNTAPHPFTRLPPMVIIAFQVLPLVIFVSALAAVLWHWKVLQFVARGLSVFVRRTLHVSGAVGLSAGVNFFMGIVEAPLFVRGYLPRLSRAELFMVMTLGMSTVSGVVLVLYSTVLQKVVGDAAVGHLLTASLISLPAAVLMAKLMVPGEGTTETTDADTLRYEGTMDALARGTWDGMQLFLSVIAMLLVIVSLVALGNILLGILPDVAGEPLTVPRLFGWIFAPFTWLIGVPFGEIQTAGALYGDKAILNEFFAYLRMADLSAIEACVRLDELRAAAQGALPAEQIEALKQCGISYPDLPQLRETLLSPRSKLVMIYAMCGFANLGSVGMIITTISTLAPERRAEAAQLGLKSWVAGNLATMMTGAVVGLITF